MVLFILSRTFFGDIYKFIYGFRNIKNINIMNKITKIFQRICPIDMF